LLKVFSTDALAFINGLAVAADKIPGGRVVSKAIFRFTIVVICSFILVFTGNHRAASAAPQEIRSQAVHTVGLGSSLSFNFFSNGTTATPESVIAADFNKDGKLDVAILDAAPRVSILSGLGSYGFGLILPANSVSANPISMAVGDFNGDGNLDLVTVGFGKISVLLGNGDLTFKPAIVQTIVSESFQRVAVGDFNKDGKLDLVITDMEGRKPQLGFFWATATELFPLLRSF
jgi:FG-GAP-like repeat